MRTPVKIAAFVVALAALFAVALGIGRLVGPIGTPPADAGHDDHDEAVTTGVPGGLQIAQDGYRLVVDTAELPAGIRTPLAFRVLGPDNRSVTDFTVEHGKELHLIVVRRDLTGFQHLHPVRAADGTWTAAVDTSVPGAYRMFAGFVPAGRSGGLTLGSDLAVAGAYVPAPFPAESRHDHVDGYTVDLAGDLTPGSAAELTLTVSRGAAPVTDLDPYLEAYGHLVALRDGDLAYLHVHPDGKPGDGSTPAGPQITFVAEVPSEGRYRLFVDFSHHGLVRTAEFTLSTPNAAGTPAGPSPSSTPAVPEPSATHGHEEGEHTDG